MVTRFALILSMISLAACQVAFDGTSPTSVDQLQFSDLSVAGATAQRDPDTLVPYGEVVRLCRAPQNLGQEIARIGGFTVYDSAPDSTDFRAHYITGFRDRCARQFSAALVTAGNAATHEFMRYLPANRSTYNATDTAYEQVKNRFCRVKSGEVCGQRVDALNKRVAFITAYETFGSRPTWVEIFLHNGTMQAVDFKKR